MIILRDSCGLTIKRRADDISHIRVGLFDTRFWVADYDQVRHVVEHKKPWVELTINEIYDMLLELDKFKELHKVQN